MRMNVDAVAVRTALPAGRYANLVNALCGDCFAQRPASWTSPTLFGRISATLSDAGGAIGDT